MIHQSSPDKTSIDLSSHDPDTSLIDELKANNDMEAFTMLMNKYKKPVLNFCFRYIGNMQDAEDISQEVFIKVFKNIRLFQGKSKFTSWLYRLTLNTCHNFKRHYIAERLDKVLKIEAEEHKEEYAEYKLKDQKPDPEQELINKELAEIIDTMICRLNKKQRSVLILKDFQGKSYEEIGEIMNMKTGTVKSALARGRLQVAMKIKEYYQS